MAEHATLAGEYETDSAGSEPQRVRVVVTNGWLTLELSGEKRIRLARRELDDRWEFVEDRTSGSTPRTLEFETTLRGAAAFILRSPSQSERRYRVVDETG